MSEGRTIKDQVDALKSVIESLPYRDNFYRKINEHAKSKKERTQVQTNKEYGYKEKES
jgi:hypothetical protein